MRHKRRRRAEQPPGHILGVHKYEALGWKYELAGTKENTPEQPAHAEKPLRSYFPQLVVN